MKRALALAATILVLGSACTSSSGAASPTATPTVTPDGEAQLLAADAFRTDATIVWETPDDIVGTPVVEGRTVLAYTRSGRGLSLTAWDAATGSRQWDTAATPGLKVPSGVRLQPATVEIGGTSFATIFVPDGASGWDTVAAVRLDTGAIVRSETVFRGHTRPDQCTHDESLICFGGALEGATGSTALTFDPATATVAEVPAGAPGNEWKPPGSASLGDGFFARYTDGADSDYTIGFAKDGAIAWERPYPEVFGPGATPNQGWAWTRTDDDKAVVGFAHASIPDEGGTIDLHATQWLAALDLATGETLWKLDGGSLCTFDAIIVDDVVIGCITSSGTQTYHHDGETWDVDPATGVTGYMTGIDVHTGAEKWRTTIGSAALAWTEDAPHFAENDATFTAPQDDGPANLVSLPSGAAHPMAADGRYACVTDPEEDSVKGPAYGPATYLAGRYAVVCDVTGTVDASAPWSVGGVALAGTDAGDSRYVLAVDGGLRMYDLTPGA